MTSKEKKIKKFPLLIILGSFASLVLGVIFLINTYAEAVDLKHGISELKLNLQKVESENILLKEKYFSLFEEAKVDQFASAKGLIKDEKPQYVEQSRWELASH
jgi:hypothetical protein